MVGFASALGAKAFLPITRFLVGFSSDAGPLALRSSELVRSPLCCWYSAAHRRRCSSHGLFLLPAFVCTILSDDGFLLHIDRYLQIRLLNEEAEVQIPIVAAFVGHRISSWKSIFPLEKIESGLKVLCCGKSPPWYVTASQKSHPIKKDKHNSNAAAPCNAAHSTRRAYQGTREACEAPPKEASSHMPRFAR